MRFAGAVIAFVLTTGHAAAQPTRWLITPEGLGPVRIGMTRPQVSAALGVRLRGEPIDDASRCIEMGASRLPGVTFMFEGGRLTRISIHDAARVTTPRGIGLGATAAQVRRAYPRGLRSEPHEYRAPPARYLTYWTRPSARGVRFETDERQRVTVIHAGAASIAYVEGCA
jgi:hypothetical protein